MQNDQTCEKSGRISPYKVAMRSPNSTTMECHTSFLRANI